MRGAKIKYETLGALLRKSREAAGLTLDAAAMMIGVTSGSYLASCELGRCNFPFSKLRRAASLYNLTADQVVERASEDYQKSLLASMKKKR